jgi:hypothetical protein
VKLHARASHGIWRIMFHSSRVKELMGYRMTQRRL